MSYGTVWYTWDGEKFVSHTTFNGTESIDWNHDRAISSSVKQNVNQDVRIDSSGNVFHNFTLLRSTDEWSNLVFNGGMIGKTGIMAQAQLPQTTYLRCLTSKEHKARNKNRSAQNQTVYR